MKRLGISIYPEKSTKEEIFAYLDMAAEAGFSRIFSCLFQFKVRKRPMFRSFRTLTRMRIALGLRLFLMQIRRFLRSLASRMEVSRSLRRSVRTAFALI